MFSLTGRIKSLARPDAIPLPSTSSDRQNSLRSRLSMRRFTPLSLSYAWFYSVKVSRFLPKDEEKNEAFWHFANSISIIFPLVFKKIVFPKKMFLIFLFFFFQESPRTFTALCKGAHSLMRLTWFYLCLTPTIYGECMPGLNRCTRRKQWMCINFQVHRR